MMRDHGVIGRHYAGAVTQIISGSIGFDDWEWGVDLFADDPVVFKKLIYEMRFDEASAWYARVRPVLRRPAVLARGAAAVPGGRGARPRPRRDTARAAGTLLESLLLRIAGSRFSRHPLTPREGFPKIVSGGNV